MASTITLQATLNWVASFLKNQPLLVSNQEPAVSIGNTVLQTMLGPPMCWRFNRKTTSIPIVSGTTDYPVTLTDLGHIESMWLQDAAGKIYELGGAVSLAKDSRQSRPVLLAPQYDSNNGTITFRVSPQPNATFTAFIDYQRKAFLMTSTGSVWGNVADEFSYIFNWGFLAIACLLVNDSRFPIFEKYFIGRLLGAQDGLDDQAKAIFLGQWLALTGALSRNQQTIASGGQGRGV